MQQRNCISAGGILRLPYFLVFFLYTKAVLQFSFELFSSKLCEEFSGFVGFFLLFLSEGSSSGLSVLGGENESGVCDRV